MSTKIRIEDLDGALAEVIARAERGEDVVVERGGVPVVRITRCDDEPSEAGTRKGVEFGFFKGRAQELDPDWWKPMTDEEVDASGQSKRRSDTIIA